ncbi:MAG: phosphatase PAP2 family protein [Actinomycetota bacterium]|nr:phosphatase PAP2 family protein [Actinomycetota bacterium]
MAITAVTVLLFVLVGDHATRPAVQKVDDAWLEGMQAVRVAPLTWVAKILDVLGGVWITAPLRVVLGLWLAHRRRWAHLTALLLAVAISEAGIGLLKDLVERPRPPSPLVDTSGFSFPSGHATAGAVSALALVIMVLPPGPARWAWEVRAVLFTLVMALSRTYLQAHWLSDAVAGTLFGTAVVLISVVVVIGLRNRLRPRLFPDAPLPRPPQHPPARRRRPTDSASSVAGATRGRRSRRQGSGARR